MTMNLAASCKTLLALSISSVMFWGIAPLSLRAETAPHWSYGGEENPTHWGDLSPDYHLCAVGRDQSPINLDHMKHNGELPPLQLSYRSAPLKIVNNGHTIQVNYGPGSSLTLDGDRYELIQFHFHTPSEHLVEGEASAMELHLVHRNAQGKLAVIGVMINEGEENEALKAIWANFPAVKEEKTVAQTTINAAALLPGDRGYSHYQGSLTTPPCSEGVQWFVMDQAITASAEQIEAFMEEYSYNARPVQPQNGRIVEHHQH